MSSESNTHTPGPWKVFVDDSGGQWAGWPLSITAPSVHEDCMVVRTGGQWPYEWDYHVSQAQAVANANLISAAPDLLQSAVLLESLCTWLLNAYGPFSPTSKEAVARVDQCRAAIAKAEGRTPSKTANPGDVNEQ